MNPRPTGPLRVNWILPPPSLAGGIRTVRELAEAMERRGHEMTLAFPNPRAPWPAPWRPRRFAGRLRSEWTLRGRRRHHLDGAPLRMIQVGGPEVSPDDVPDADVTIATWWKTMEWIRDWPPSKGIHAYYVQGHELHAGPPARVLATYRQPAQKFAVSRWLQRVMAEEYGDRGAAWIPVGLDHALFAAPPRGKATSPTVGFMYSRRAWKGGAAAFEALRIVQQAVPELRVLSFGDGGLAGDPPRLRNFELRVAPPQEAIAALYRRCDCWLVPSESEGFGLPGLEAAACRCPVVSTRCGGPEDYVREGENGFLVPVGDAKAMAARVLEVITRPEAEWRALSDASHVIASGFDWDRSAERLEDLLRGALARAAGREA